MTPSEAGAPEGHLVGVDGVGQAAAHMPAEEGEQHNQSVNQCYICSNETTQEFMPVINQQSLGLVVVFDCAHMHSKRVQSQHSWVQVL
jgi:hypothetical protein